MRRLFEALASDGRRRDFLVWAGAGDGSNVPAARALGPRHALYIEPHPVLRSRLAARHALAGNESLSDRPLARTRGPAVFHVTNDAASSALTPPAPGSRRNIRVVEQRPVETDDLDSALHAIPVDATAGLLVLDAGGDEPQVVEGATGDALARFDTIVVPARARTRVAAVLERHGFEAAEAVHDENGHEWAVFAARRDDGEGAVAGLRAGLDEARATVDALRAELAQANASLEALRAEASGLRAAQAAAAEAAAAARGEHAHALQAASDEHARAMDALRGEHTRAVAEAEARHAGRLAEHEAALDALRRELDAAAAAGQALEQERARASALQARVERLEQDLDAARQVANLSVKLQARRDADLADLQARYRDAQAVQARQRELLEKLGARLGVASRHFHQLVDGRGPGSGDGTD